MRITPDIWNLFSSTGFVAQLSSHHYFKTALIDKGILKNLCLSRTVWKKWASEAELGWPEMGRQLSSFPKRSQRISLPALVPFCLVCPALPAYPALLACPALPACISLQVVAINLLLQSTQFCQISLLLLLAKNSFSGNLQPVPVTILINLVRA